MKFSETSTFVKKVWLKIRPDYTRDLESIYVFGG